jgi:hypothetical protein
MLRPFSEKLAELETLLDIQPSYRGSMDTYYNVLSRLNMIVYRSGRVITQIGQEYRQLNADLAAGLGMDNPNITNCIMDQEVPPPQTPPHSSRITKSMGSPKLVLPPSPLNRTRQNPAQQVFSPAVDSVLRLTKELITIMKWESFLNTNEDIIRKVLIVRRHLLTFPQKSEADKTDALIESFKSYTGEYKTLESKKVETYDTPQLRINAIVASHNKMDNHIQDVMKIWNKLKETEMLITAFLL